MPKYINASEAEMIIESEAENLYGEGLDVSAHRVWKLQNKIRDLPSADVRENTHGEWKGGALCGYDMYGEAVITPITCSECKYEAEEGSNFCPNCGADMRERKETK